MLGTFEGAVGEGESASDSSSTGSTDGVLGSFSDGASAAPGTMVAVVSSANVEAVALEAELDEVGACEKMAKARIANVDEGRGGGVCCC